LRGPYALISAHQLGRRLSDQLEAPVMIITDGAYEQELKTAREHAT